MNGNAESQPPTPSGAAAHKPLHDYKPDYKLLIDPALVKGANKLYRYDGVVPNDPQYTVVAVKDPRNVKALRLRTRLDPIELPVPR